MTAAHPLRAPAGAVGWCPHRGWLYSPAEASAALDSDDYVLVVSDDGMVRGVQPTDRAPLFAVLRVEADVAEVVRRLDDLADRIEGRDTSDSMELVAIKARLRRLEERDDR